MTNENSVTADTATSKAASRASSNKPPDLVKRIGNTTYEVSFHFSDTSKDTFTDKIARLIRRDLQNECYSSADKKASTVTAIDTVSVEA